MSSATKVRIDEKDMSSLDINWIIYPEYRYHQALQKFVVPQWSLAEGREPPYFLNFKIPPVVRGGKTPR